MEWFELVYDGPQDTFKDMMREDYKEPKIPVDLIEEYDKGKSVKSLPELMAKLDCYIGHVDGYAYSSYDRLVRMRKKGVFKPKAPTDMYQYPGTDSMKSGWWMQDEKLKNETWFKPVVEFRKVPTDVTRYFQEALIIDPCFKL